MKVDFAKFEDVITEDVGDIESQEADIDEANLPLIFEMFSKQLYSNPEGSIVREITSNCFDSHIEAEVDHPVVLEFFYEEGQHYLQFQDFGVGLSPERISKIYKKYLSSTKRDSNKYIGAFGLGSKSPLAYSDFFFITTVFAGIKYQYIMSKTKLKPVIDLMFEEPTEEGNGTIIKVPIRSNSIQKFETELTTQLFYFDNVYVKTNELIKFENIYKVYDFQNFKFRTSTSKREMSLVIDKVNYPIDWVQIDQLYPINIPVALKFDIGEIPVTPNRESIRYTEEAKSLIKGKLIQCLRELENLAKSEKNYVCKTLKEFRDNKKGDFFKIKLEEKDFIPVWKNYLKKSPIESPHYVLDIYKDIPFSVFYEWINPVSFLFKADKIITDIGTLNTTEDKVEKVLDYTPINNFWLTRTEGKDRVKNYYIYNYLARREYVGSQGQNIAYANYILKSKNKKLKELKLLLSKKFTDPKNQKAAKLNGLSKLQCLSLFKQKVEEELKSLTFDYDSIKVPEWVIKEYKAKFYPPKIKNTSLGLNVILVNQSSSTGRVGKDYVKRTIADLGKHKGFYYYSTKDEAELENLEKVSKIFKDRKEIRFIAFNKTEVKLIKDFKNFRHYTAFNNTSNRLYKNMVVASYLVKIPGMYNFLYYNSDYFKWHLHFNRDFRKWNLKLLAFQKKYKTGALRLSDDEHKELFYKFLGETSIEQEFHKILNFQEGLKLFSFSTMNLALDDKEYLDDIVVYLKAKKKKLNPEHYFIPTIEEQIWIKQGEELNEYREQIKQLN